MVLRFCIPVAAVQRNARSIPSAVFDSPTTTEPLEETSNARLPTPPSVPRSCSPPAAVHRKALPFEELPTMVEPSADTLYAALQGPNVPMGSIPFATVHRKACSK